MIEKFLHFKSDRAIASRDRHISRRINEIIESISQLERKIPEDIRKGDIDSTVKDVTTLIDLIMEEERDVEQMERDSAVQDYDLLKEVGKVEDKLETIQEKRGTQELNEDMQKLHSLTSQIEDLINKARIEARDAKNDRERMLKFRAFLGYHQIAIDIKNMENEIRAVITGEKSAESDINHAETPEIKKDVAEFCKLADKEAEDIYKVEHDDIIFTFYILNKLELVAHILEQLRREGFPWDKQEILESHYFKAKAQIQEASKQAYRMEKYMQTRTHKLAA